MKKKEQVYYQLISNIELSAWNTYPRPQMKRDSYLCLNGIWTIAGENIRVPFPPESYLSGFPEEKIKDEMLYEKRFVLPEKFTKSPSDRILLHLGAVDQIGQIFVNNRPLCRHEGGYLPFTVDITDVVYRDGSENILNVFAEDRLDHKYPWGKQTRKRGGMWYTPVSGIWQTVWLEAVPSVYITGLKMTPLEGHRLAVTLDTNRAVQTPVFWQVSLPEKKAVLRGRLAAGETILDLDAEAEKTGVSICWEEWTPETPVLYPISFSIGADRVSSYFALRTVEIKAVNGKKRICLNGKPIFLKGVLDQGYFSDGLFLPAGPDGYEQDIRGMKELGFNMLRKHIKVEPELFYYACDRLGMLVWQDMVNNGNYHYLHDTILPTIGLKGLAEKHGEGSSAFEKERRAFFVQHSKETIRHLYNHPCVIGYTVFNEGWGQFDSERIGDELRTEDTSRFYDYTSGWFEHGGSDIRSIHEYFHPQTFRQQDKPPVITECGGYSLAVEEHTYRESGGYGYGKCRSREELTGRIEQMYEKMILPSAENGLCGLIYTQVSDIEDEINGFYTYDRRVLKVIPERVRTCNEKADAVFEKALQE